MILNMVVSCERNYKQKKIDNVFSFVKKWQTKLSIYIQWFLQKEM